MIQKGGSKAVPGATVNGLTYHTIGTDWAGRLHPTASLLRTGKYRFGLIAFLIICQDDAAIMLRVGPLL
jgi:hypothetical protein